MPSLAGKPGRISCCIDGCGRSWPDDGQAGVIICQRHWRQGPAELRNRIKKAGSGIRKAERRHRYRAAWYLRYKHDRLLFRLIAAVRGEDRPAGVDAFLEEMGLH